ncbi:MAG: DNA polymerase I [Alphaproteobacteria bacterium]|nr:DNA polymerase I [Alphaproteobacteria bacterium]
MSKVCLIDGSGYIFRAFYALPTMTAPDGTPVNAVYGFVTMFMRLLKNIPCDYCVVLFDAKRQNFRNEFFAEYKANRAETPELLIPQFDLIHQAVEVMGLPYIMQEGYEADDLIATYARQAKERGLETVVVSADKDLMQLIQDGVQYYDGMKDKYYTPEDVKEKFGVYPDKVIDVQALSGDKIDNVPGVPGIGPKTAAELVNEYGSLQGVLANVDKIKQQKRREVLAANKEAAEISLKLVTLKDDVPVLHQLDEFKCKAPQSTDLMAFIDKYGFKSIRPKMEKWIAERCVEVGETAEAESAKAPLPDPVYAKIGNRQQLEALYKSIKSSAQVALQTMFTDGKVVGISLSPKPFEAYYLPLPQQFSGGDLFSFENNSDKELEFATVRKFLLAILNDGDVLKIAADIKTQWHQLNALCEETLNLWPYDDLAIMSYDLDSSEHEHNLTTLAAMFLDIELPEPKVVGKKTTIDFEAEEYGNYVYAAADCISRLHLILKERLFSEHKNYVYEALDRRLAGVLMKMEQAGIVVNDKALALLDAEFEAKMQETAQEIYALAGEEFNINSPAQIGQLLFGKMGLKGKKTPSGKYNTSAEVLEQLAEEYEIAAKILEWRSYAKLKSTYTTALLEVRDKESRVHTTFSQTVVNTGRLASSNPNLQNIPNRTDIGRKIRRCFEAKAGYKLVAADYSQMELRLMASVADVKALKEAFAQGKDIHAATAARVFGLDPDNVDREHRSRAKAINFGIIYGISQFGLAKQINVSREMAKQYIDSYFAIMPEVKAYMDKTMVFAHQHGYVETPFGRKCALAGINDQNQRIVSFAERAAINAPIQGGAADIVKLAMQRIDAALQEQKLDARLLLQVHDELVVEAKDCDVPKVAELLKQIMENAAETSVKLEAEVGVGTNWNDAH